MGGSADIQNHISGTIVGTVVQAGSIDHLILHPALQGIESRGTDTTTASAGLPPAPTEFVGRQSELATLVTAISSHTVDEHPTVIAEITGMGGIGKTSLALKAAHAVMDAGDFPGGVLFLDLQGYSANPLSVSEGLTTLLRAIGEKDYRHDGSDSQSAQQLFRSLMARRGRTLILLEPIGKGFRRVLDPARPQPNAVDPSVG